VNPDEMNVLRLVAMMLEALGGSFEIPEDSLGFQDDQVMIYVERDEEARNLRYTVKRHKVIPGTSSLDTND